MPIRLLLALIAAFDLIYWGWLLTSGYYAYGAESLNLTPLIRMAHGLSFASATQPPVFFTCYTPLYVWLVYPLARLLGLSGLGSVATLARLLSFGSLAACVALVRGLARREPGMRASGQAFLTAFLLFFGIEPDLLLSARGDLFSFAAELSGAILLYDSLFVRADRRAGHLAGAGAALALAAAFKPNTLGFLAGALLYLGWRRSWKDLAALASSTAAAGALLLLAMRWIGGAEPLRTVFETALARPYRGAEWVSIWLNQLKGFFLMVAPIFGLTVAGLVLVARTSEQGEEKTRYLGSLLASSLLVALLGQAKWGATVNYFFGFFLLALVPVSVAIDRLQFDAQPAVNAAYFVMLALVLGGFALKNAQALVMTEANLRHLPYAEARARLERERGTGLVYVSGEEDAALHLLPPEAVALSTSSEMFLHASPLLLKYVPGIASSIRANGGIRLAVIAAGGCEDWKPRGLFGPELARLTSLRWRIDKICVFGEEPR